MSYFAKGITSLAISNLIKKITWGKYYIGCWPANASSAKRWLIFYSNWPFFWQPNKLPFPQNWPFSQQKKVSLQQSWLFLQTWLEISLLLLVIFYFWLKFGFLHEIWLLLAEIWLFFAENLAALLPWKCKQWRHGHTGHIWAREIQNEANCNSAMQLPIFLTVQSCIPAAAR